MITTKELISLENESNTKDELIFSLADLAFKNHKLNDMNKFIEAVYKRENEFSTALGMSIAMPHGQSDAVEEPFVIFARTNKDVHWDDNDVRMIFMIGVPLKNRSEVHMKIIAALSKKLMDEQFRNSMMTADEDSVIELLRL